MGTVRQVGTSAGPIDCLDMGTGPELLLLHGMHMTGSLWRDVVSKLHEDHRVLVPTLPLGGQSRQLPASSDRSITGMARLLSEIISELGLQRPIIVGNDTGGALIQISLPALAGRVAGVILVACEAYENFPPGLPGRVSRLAARLPGGLFWTAQTMRLPGFARMPFTFGWMAKRGIPAEMVQEWFAGLRASHAVRTDTRQLIGSVNADVLLDAALSFPSFTEPVLVVWAAEDRVMPHDHADRLAASFPNGQKVEVPDTYTLIPLDQPVALASLIRRFVATQSRTDTAGPAMQAELRYDRLDLI